MFSYHSLKRKILIIENRLKNINLLSTQYIMKNLGETQLKVPNFVRKT